MENTRDAGERLSLSDLKPTMKLEGRVTKTELFGAFVDVGAERDGLVHISMLKPGGVYRVDDVVREGQVVEVWVHRVEPENGRLELSMLKPIMLKWKDIKKGMKLKGKVVRLESFGAFIDVGAERPGLVHVSEMSSDYISNPSDMVNVGDEVKVSVIDVDRRKRQIRFSMKETMIGIEPEEEEPAEEMPTAMELALREALEQSDNSSEKPGTDSLPGKKQVKDQELEDILARTLKHRVRTASTNE
ncbi:MAG: S1 RNA-binding domain-containing protein [Anaerolineales bacterium]|nr:S1 RNA-binding domain-containing protein [Anaerolineales bacterium]